jgi:hypothetical protein
MKQAQLNNGFTVVAVFVKQLRHIWKRWFLASLAPITPVFDCNFLEAILSDEDGEHLFLDVVFAIVLLAAIGRWDAAFAAASRRNCEVDLGSLR